MIVARFADAAGLQGAAAALRAAGLPVETRTPIALPADEDGGSRIPTVILVAALAGFAGAFAMQCYANLVSYPQLIGGRPAFFWSSYLVWSVEAGVLAATTTAVLAYFVSNRLPRYYEPSDDSEALREATRDGWFLITDGVGAPRILAAHGAAASERVAA